MAGPLVADRFWAREHVPGNIDVPVFVRGYLVRYGYRTNNHPRANPPAAAASCGIILGGRNLSIPTGARMLFSTAFVG